MSSRAIDTNAMSVDNLKLINVLKLKRKREGLSLRKLSSEIGVSFSTLARIERGDGEPDNNSAIRILEWLGEDGRSAGLKFDNVAFVHFRAAKNVDSMTVENLLEIADLLKSSFISEFTPEQEPQPIDISNSELEYQALSLSKPEMEEMASKFRSELGLSEEERLPALAIKISGVDVYDVKNIKSVDSTNLKHLLSEGSRQWSAMSVPLNFAHTRWAIVRNTNHKLERQRVTYLEEFWHIYLGHRLTKIARIASSYGRSYESSEEHDAYYLATASLLPDVPVTKMIFESKTAIEVGDHFGTSPELVEYRIKRLGLWGFYKGLQIEVIPED